MYEDEIRKIERTIKKLRGTGAALAYLDKKLEKLYKIYTEDSQLISEYNPQEQIMRTMRPRATEILLENALRAVTLTEEFDLPIFTDGLIKAIKDPRTIRLSARWGDFDVKIDLDRTAGTLKDYARAVTQVRKARNISKYRSHPLSPELASYMWMEKYYRPAREGAGIEHPSGREVDVEAYINKYYDTIAQRVDAFEGNAPFWRVLNYGTDYKKMQGGWGGKAYPSYGPTRFVEKSIAQIKKLFKSKQKKYNQNLIDLTNAHQEMRNLIQWIENFYDQIQIGKAVPPVAVEIEEEPSLLEIVQAKLEQQLGVRFSQVSVDKLARTISNIIDDPEESRVSLGYTTEGQRIQVRVKNIQKLLSEYRKR